MLLYYNDYFYHYDVVLNVEYTLYVYIFIIGLTISSIFIHIISFLDLFALHNIECISL